MPQLPSWDEWFDALRVADEFMTEQVHGEDIGIKTPSIFGIVAGERLGVKQEDGSFETLTLRRLASLINPLFYWEIRTVLQAAMGMFAHIPT